jgi:ABC-2 type transport system permease protein
MRQFALRQNLLSVKALPVFGIALFPSLMAFAFRVFKDAGLHSRFDFYGEYLAPIFLYLVLPFFCMTAILPLMHSLYDKGAIGYLVTRPTPRWVILLGLYQGALLAMIPALLLAVITPLLLLSIGDTSGALGGDSASTGAWFQRAIGLFGVLFMGSAAYSAVCLFLGAWSKKAAIWGFGLLIGWGATIGSVPGLLQPTSPHRYLFGLLREWCGIKEAWTGFFAPDLDPPGVVLSIVVLISATALFLWMAWRASRSRDIL